MFKGLFLFIFLFIISGCSGLEDSEKERIHNMNATGEYIYRTHDEILFAIEPPKKIVRKRYPWEHTYIGGQIRINKEFFRCKGSGSNDPLTKQTSNGPEYVFDCGGIQQHSLPLKNGKEFIYPALIELLNYIQEKTQKKVVITCGYRCPTHNAYSDNSLSNRISKHMIGAEVDFYVEGLEWSPKTIISLIKNYYFEHPTFRNIPELCNFKRKQESGSLKNLPWYNKEIFIKIFEQNEGRDFDNSHLFPYVSIQLKWDREEDKPIFYSWSAAFNNYLRY